MRTVLVADGRDPPMVAPGRASRYERLLARTMTQRLDRSLAEGMSPDSSPILSLRAHRLIGATTRQKFANELRQLMRAAERAHHPFDPTIPLARREILLARETLGELADALDTRDPVDAQGVAQVHLLLTDSASPLYKSRRGNVLNRSLENALDALAPWKPSRTGA